MEKMEVKTGFGYFSDLQGHIVSKYELSKGQHLLKEGYTFTEVDTKVDLNKIEVYVPPETEEQIEEEKIQVEMRQMAIDSLKKKGEIS